MLYLRPTVSPSIFRRCVDSALSDGSQKIARSLRRSVIGPALVLAACHATPQTRPASAPPPAAESVDEIEARELIGALTTEDVDKAEAHFDQRMRSALPGPVLLSQWRSLQARQGALSSWQVVSHDHPTGKDRFTLELMFSKQTIDCRVVFEASTHEVVGLFFSKKPRDVVARDGSDPDVHEETLSVGPLALPATWVVPAKGTPPLPAALFIGGSGPNDRDESVSNAKPFRDLANGLAKYGIASLRYDKRAFVHPELLQDPERATVEDEVLVDAVAALQLLHQRPEVDPARIFVIGHSLGALLAPEVAKRAGGVAGLVLLAAPGRPLEQIVLEQLKAMQPRADFSGLERQVQALPDLPAASPLLGMPAGYWRDLDRRDEPGIAVELGRPVLLLRGSLDRNVAAVDQERWRAALSDRVSVKSATLPGLDHIFLSVTERGEQRHVAPQVVEAIAQFIRHP